MVQLGSGWRALVATHQWHQAWPESTELLYRWLHYSLQGRQASWPYPWQGPRTPSHAELPLDCGSPIILDPRCLTGKTQKTTKFHLRPPNQVCSHIARGGSCSPQMSLWRGLYWNRCSYVIWQKLPAASWHNSSQTQASLLHESIEKQLVTLLYFVKVPG